MCSQADEAEVDVLRMAWSLGVANWAASVVCLLMIVLYMQRAECAGPDPDAAYLAVAWGVILGVALSGAVNKTRRWFHQRAKRDLSG